jgi:two-component system KDP operon response regulator KdpE
MNSTAPAVLIIDDEVQIRRFLQSGFGLVGFSVREAKTATEGIRSATLSAPDLIILDLALPDMDGAEVLQRIRSWSEVPIIVLSARSNEDEKVRLLELGADDYVVKPFGMAELLARARAAMRRQQRTTTGDAVLKIGRVTFDFAARSVSIDGRRISLTRKEYRLLQVLAQHAGNVLTHQHLLKEVWGTSHLNDVHYLRIMIRNLRKKIEADPTRPRIIRTELGVGYRLGTDDAEPTEAADEEPTEDGAPSPEQAEP